MQTTLTPTKAKKVAADLAVLAVITAAVALFVVTIGYLGLLPLGRSSVTAAGQQVLVTDQFQFMPEELRLKTGEPVTIILDNRELLPHSFDVDEFDVHAPMPGKERAAITFTPTQAGTYTFYCGVPGHQAGGMSGTLIVQDK